MSERDSKAKSNATQAGKTVGDPAKSAANATATSDANAPSPSATAAPAGAPELTFTWDDPVRLMKSLSAAWREVTDREIPTFLQLAQSKIDRIDADVQSGFVAITVDGETHHAIGMRREAVVPLVTVLSKRSADEVGTALAKGPAKFQTNPA